MIFLIKDRLRMRNSLIVRHLILRVLCKICLFIKEIFTVLLTTDFCRVFNNYNCIKTLNYKKLRRNRQKLEIFFFVKFQAPFPPKIIIVQLYISCKAFIR